MVGWSVAVRGNSEMEKWRYSLKSLRGTGREREAGAFLKGA